MKIIKVLITVFFIMFIAGILSSCSKSKKSNKYLPLHSAAKTPPMGWNSYMCFANDVNEAQVKANTKYMADNLKEYGWEYIVIDVDWYKPPDSSEFRGGDSVSLDEYGRLIPNPKKFPSAKNRAGFGPLADYIHSKGLKFGVHIMRGIPKEAVKLDTKILGTNYTAKDIADTNNLCDWNSTMMGINYTHPGGQAYIQSIIDLYAEWGVDYVKADDMTAKIYQVDEITAFGTAFKRQSRKMVFSLSPGPSPLGAAEHLGNNAHLWRVCNDYWDTWDDLKEQFALCALWVPYISENNWPDADMLPIGKLRKTGTGQWEANKLNTTVEEATDEFSRLTKNEQIMMMNLWSMFRSPLMIGGNLPENDDFTNSLITNKTLLAINQESTNTRVLYNDEKKSIWLADSEDGRYRYLAIFNISENVMDDEIKLEEVGLNKNRIYKFENIWSKEKQSIKNKLTFILEKHTSVLYRVEI